MCTLNCNSLRFWMKVKTSGAVSIFKFKDFHLAPQNLHINNRFALPEFEIFWPNLKTKLSIFLNTSCRQASFVSSRKYQFSSSFLTIRSYNGTYAFRKNSPPTSKELSWVCHHRRMSVWGLRGQNKIVFRGMMSFKNGNSKYE